MLGRSQINLAPILGVLMVLFVGFSWSLCYEPIQVPRKLDEVCECPDQPLPSPPHVHLHADGSIDLTRSGQRKHVEAPHVAATLASLEPSPAANWAADLRSVVYVQADDGVRWGDFVETVSSVRHITGGEVAVVSVDE